MQNNSRNSFQSVLSDAEGRWVQLFKLLGGGALDEAIECSPRHVGCPVNGGKDGFRLFADFEVKGNAVSNQEGVFKNGIDLLAWLLDVEAKKALRLVRDALDGEAFERLPVRNASSKAKRKGSKVDLADWQLSNMVALLDISVPSGISAEANLYFEKRGISGLAQLPKVIRFVKETQSEKEMSKGVWSCIVSVVQSGEGRIVSLHRIFIDDSGSKAPLETSKMLMSSPNTITGAAIRLAQVEDGRLGLAEGVETALSVMAFKHVPVWSTISAQGLEAVELPPAVKIVDVYADLDKSGRGVQAFMKLQYRVLDEIVVHLHLPPSDLPVIINCVPKEPALSLDKCLLLANKLEAGGRVCYVVMPRGAALGAGENDPRIYLRNRLLKGERGAHVDDDIWPFSTKGIDWLDYFNAGS